MVPILLVITVLILILVLYSLIENRFIKTEHYYIEEKCIKQNQTFRIVQLSDLHRCHYGKNNSKLLAKIRNCKPNLVVMTGDMINRDGKYSDELLQFYRNLAADYPCLYSLGNHETRFRNVQPIAFDKYQSEMQQCGISILDNEAAIIKAPVGQITVYGYTANVFFYQEKDCNYRINLPVPESKSVFSILLSHNPEMIDNFQNNRFSLVLSGHLHGGIVRIPHWRGLISPHFCLFPKYDGGMYALEHDGIMIVSRGLGSHTIKFRLFNRPELVCIHVKGSKANV